MGCSCPLGVAGMNESLMANKKVAPSESFGTNIAYEWFFLGVRPAVSILAVAEGAGTVCLGLPDVSLEMLEASEEALTVRTW
jgi:hypothetical protein